MGTLVSVHATPQWARDLHAWPGLFHVPGKCWGQQDWASKVLGSSEPARLSMSPARQRTAAPLCMRCGSVQGQRLPATAAHLCPTLQTSVVNTQLHKGNGGRVSAACQLGA